MEGYIKLHRSILDNPVVCKDAEYFTVWTYLLLNATHTECDMIFNGKRITLKAGQLITGRKSISERFNISESKVQRVMKKLEIEQQIEQQTCSKNRLISIVNWHLYQSTEHLIEQQVNNNRTTSEQQVNTNKNVKNDNNVKNEKNNTVIFPYLEIIEYLNQKANTKYRSSSNKTQTLIKARYNEKFSIEDFKKVIDDKVAEWKGTDMANYLRPETLFGTKFESYLNQKVSKQKSKNEFNQIEQREYDFDKLEKEMLGG